ncbi:hypothetical protein SAMN05444851_1542 [Aliiroseovarius sediminilitoris]|uniref:Uncharacterized protein n=1 Tax=Aliiroseovarius sediminilitoris TaxID=1173584 RepID=A0A1I0PD12_9RHOB|nr:hypothetical protein [Aliiroseovarius sediminilitoris]SEW12048.1 hypothetical protein SAMN05444851_1542 [Aliiroseovarius sediminilitoris]
MGKSPRPKPKVRQDAKRPAKRPEASLPDTHLGDLERLVGDGALRVAIDRLLERTPDKDIDKDIDKVCKKMFQALRKRCPHLVPDRPVNTGQIGPRIDLGPKTVVTLFRGAAVKLAGDKQTVWVLGDSEMLVFASRVVLETEPGRIVVHLPVSTDQTKDVVIKVPFAVGSEKRPAGLMATTPMRPIGPEEIVEIWADALTAFAWGAVLTLAEVLANRAGQDPDRNGLIAFNLLAGAGGLTIGTMARHGFDRRAP